MSTRALCGLLLMVGFEASAGDAMARLPTVEVKDGAATTRYEPARIVAMLVIISPSILAAEGVQAERPIAVVFDDGRVLWSQDALSGGPPYRSAQLPAAEVQRLEKLPDSFDEASAAQLTKESLGPDATAATLYVRPAASRWVLMKSWHPRDPKSKTIATSTGLVARDGRDPKAVLAADTAEYRRFREIWAQLEDGLLALTKRDGKKVTASFTWAWAPLRR